MSSRAKVSVLTVTLAAVAFFLGPVIWPMSVDIPELSGVEFGLFVGLAAWEALLLGACVSFLVFGGVGGPPDSPAWEGDRGPARRHVADGELVGTRQPSRAHRAERPRPSGHRVADSASPWVAGLVLAYLFVDALRGNFQIWPRASQLTKQMVTS
jgi:hypothetical protein